MNVLDRILKHKREELSDLKLRTPISELIRIAQDQEAPRGFHQALLDGPNPSLIAEVKKASPSAGVLRQEFDHVERAKLYESSGASALSVLTDKEFFQGSPRFLADCRNATRLPVMRKDFTVDPYHIYEARALGADAILLIVHALSDGEIRDYLCLARDMGMDALVEAHNIREAERALSNGATLLGLNNRDLDTFEVTIQVSLKVLPMLQGRATLVSESALETADDVRKVAHAGARAVLIGSALSKSADPLGAAKTLMGW